MLRLYKHYYSFLWKYKPWLVLFMVAMLILVTARSLVPYFNQLFVDAVIENNLDFIWRLLVIYIAAYLIDEIATQFLYFFGDKALLPAARDARVHVLEKIQELDLAFHQSRSTGALISAMKRGDSAYFQLFHNFNNQMLRVLLSFIILLGLMTQVGWGIVGIIFATFVVNVVAMFFLLQHNIATQKAFNDAEDEISGIIVDNLINYETVKLFAKEAREIKRLEHNFKDWLLKLWRFSMSFRIMDTVVGLVGITGIFGALALGLIRLRAGEITPGQYVFIVSFVGIFYPQFFDLMYQLRNIAKAHVDIQKYFQYLDMATKVKDPVRPKTLKKVRGEIVFDKVGFSFADGKKDALQNFDLKINTGESIALVGHSGAGKTTVTKLLLRFFDPNHGRILLDGTNIARVTKSHLRSFIGVVPQEPILFNNTIAHNIAYGADDVTQQQIEHAAKLANLHDFILSMPNGYKTNVGERGVKLSGGQKQRLAIARMVVSDPKIIIFDEATSQLDSESEKKIQEAFWRVAKDKTTIIIAHRLSTVVNADRIVVMKDGQIVEIGSHRALYRQPKSLYRHFWRLQEGDLAEPST